MRIYVFSTGVSHNLFFNYCFMECHSPLPEVMHQFRDPTTLGKLQFQEWSSYASTYTFTHPVLAARSKHVDLVQPQLHELNPGGRLLLGSRTFGQWSPAPSTSQPAHFCTPHWHRQNRCLCGPMGLAHDLHPVSHWATCPC